MNSPAKITIIAVVAIALWLLAALTIFPILCGVFRVGIPNTNIISSIAKWHDHAMQYGWFTYGFDIAISLAKGQSVNPRMLNAIYVSLGLPIIGMSVLALLFTEQRPKAGKSSFTRRLTRGAHLVVPTDMPGTIAELVADAAAPNNNGQRRKLTRQLLKLAPTRGFMKQIIADTQTQRRTLTAAEARAEARTAIIADTAAQELRFVRLAGIPMPPDLETYHALFCASTGTGKSVALRQLLGDLRRRGDRVIIVDAGYEFSRTFRKEQDFLLSPTDADSLGWDLRNEVRRDHEWPRFVESVVPAIGKGESAQWAAKAQTFFADICRSAADQPNSELLKIATAWPLEALQKLLDGTPSSALLADGGDRYLASVRGNLSKALTSWQDGKSGDFSLRDYMTSDDPRWLWLPYKDADKSVCGPAIGSWLDILVLAGLERAGANSKRKTWLIMDELDSIGTVSGLTDAVTRLRKSNVAVVAAIQDYSQLKQRYGDDTASTLFGCFSSKVFLRCNHAELAEKVSKELGRAEFEETRVTSAASSSSSSGSSRTQRGTGRNTTVSSNLVQADVMLPSEIMALPTRTGFVKLTGINAIYPTTLHV